jgi:cytochrome b involved in lipid metabolism
MSKTFSKDDVASHSKGDSLWIVIDEDVYDVTKFQDEHPGKFFFVDESRSRKKKCHATGPSAGPTLEYHMC